MFNMIDMEQLLYTKDLTFLGALAPEQLDLLVQRIEEAKDDAYGMGREDGYDDGYGDGSDYSSEVVDDERESIRAEVQAEMADLIDEAYNNGYDNGLQEADCDGFEYTQEDWDNLNNRMAEEVDEAYNAGYEDGRSHYE